MVSLRAYPAAKRYGTRERAVSSASMKSSASRTTSTPRSGVCGGAFSQPRKESPQCCHGEHQEEHVSCDVARPVTECGVEARIVPESRLGVDVHAAIKIGPTQSQRLKD